MPKSIESLEGKFDLSLQSNYNREQIINIPCVKYFDVLNDNIF